MYVDSSSARKLLDAHAVMNQSFRKALITSGNKNSKRLLDNCPLSFFHFVYEQKDSSFCRTTPFFSFGIN